MTRINLIAVAALVAAILLGGAIWAQTKATSPQLAAVGTGRVWVSYQDQLRHAKLVGGTLVEAGGDLELRFSGVAPAWKTEQRVPTAAAPVIQLVSAPVAGSLVVARNGLLQWEGDDYTLTGQTVTLPFAQPADRLVFRYQVAP